jgi:hypothetical protein
MGGRLQSYVRISQTGRAQNPNSILDRLPVKVTAKIQKLAKGTGLKPIAVIENALRIYERYFVEAPGDVPEKSERFTREDRKVLSRIMRQIGLRTPKEVFQERGRMGGAARRDALTPEERSAQAKKASEARWKKGRRSPGGSQGEPD